MKKNLLILLILVVFLASCSTHATQPITQLTTQTTTSTQATVRATTKATTATQTPTATEATTLKVKPLVSGAKAAEAVKNAVKDTCMIIPAPEDNAVVERDGVMYYNIPAYFVGEGSFILGNAGCFSVNVMTAEVYELDISTDQRVPLKNIDIISKDDTESIKYRNEVSLLFPEQDHIYVFRFVKREGREYYVFKIPGEEANKFLFDYYYYDLITKELFKWNLEKDTLKRLKK